MRVHFVTMLHSHRNITSVLLLRLCVYFNIGKHKLCSMHVALLFSCCCLFLSRASKIKLGIADQRASVSQMCSEPGVESLGALQSRFTCGRPCSPFWAASAIPFQWVPRPAVSLGSATPRAACRDTPLPERCTWGPWVPSPEPRVCCVTQRCKGSPHTALANFLIYRDVKHHWGPISCRLNTTATTNGNKMKAKEDF